MRIAMKKLVQFDSVLLATVVLIGVWILGYSLGATVQIDNSIDWSSWVTAITTLGIFAAAFLFRYDYQSQQRHQIRLEAAREIISLQPKIHLMDFRITLTEVALNLNNIDHYISNPSSYDSLYESLTDCSKKMQEALKSLNNIATQSLTLITTQPNNITPTNYGSDYENLVSSFNKLALLLFKLTLSKTTFQSFISGETTDKINSVLIKEIREINFSELFSRADCLQASTSSLILFCQNELKGNN